MMIKKTVVLLVMAIGLSACGKKVSGDFVGTWSGSNGKNHLLTITSEGDHYIVRETGIPDIFGGKSKEKTYVVKEIDQFTVQSADKDTTLSITPDKKEIHEQGLVFSKIS